MRVWIDHYWQAAAEAAIRAAIEGQANVLGPVFADDVWIVCVRADLPLPLPEGCTTIEETRAPLLLGRWAGEE